MLFLMEKPSDEMSPEELKRQWYENKALFDAKQDMDKIFSPGRVISNGGGIDKAKNPFGFDLDEVAKERTELSSDDAGEHRVG